MRLLPAIIIAIALLLVPVLWFALPRVFVASSDGFQGPAIDSGARIEIEMLNQQIDDLRNTISDLSGRVNEVANRPAPMVQPNFAPQPTAPQEIQPLVQDGENNIIDVYAQVVLIANRKKVNRELQLAGPTYLGKTFGQPRQNLTNDCMPMTNPRLKSKLFVGNVGPIKVQMLRPAVDSLTRVFEKVRATDPDLYDRINTAGSLCVRLIRGSTNRASTHSYGLAVDLNIDGKLDTLGDGRTQLGLTILADFFREEGWIWGAAWGREDSMHFEVSRQKIREWIDAGEL